MISHSSLIIHSSLIMKCCLATWADQLGDSDPALTIDQARGVFSRGSFLIVVEIDIKLALFRLPTQRCIGPAPQGANRISAVVAPARTVAAHINVPRRYFPWRRCIDVIGKT
jgi:hypothetical protein